METKAWSLPEALLATKKKFSVFVTWLYLYCVFTNIYSLLIDKDLCESKKISIKFPSALLVYMCLSSGNPLFFPLFIPIFVLKKFLYKISLH